MCLVSNLAIAAPALTQDNYDIRAEGDVLVVEFDITNFLGEDARGVRATVFVDVDGQEMVETEIIGAMADFETQNVRLEFDLPECYEGIVGVEIVTNSMVEIPGPIGGSIPGNTFSTIHAILVENDCGLELQWNDIHFDNVEYNVENDEFVVEFDAVNTLDVEVDDVFVYAFLDGDLESRHTVFAPNEIKHFRFVYENVEPEELRMFIDKGRDPFVALDERVYVINFVGLDADFLTQDNVNVRYEDGQVVVELDVVAVAQFDNVHVDVEALGSVQSEVLENFEGRQSFRFEFDVADCYNGDVEVQIWTYTLEEVQEDPFGWNLQLPAEMEHTVETINVVSDCPVDGFSPASVPQGNENIPVENGDDLEDLFAQYEEYKEVYEDYMSDMEKAGNQREKDRVIRNLNRLDNDLEDLDDEIDKLKAIVDEDLYDDAKRLDSKVRKLRDKIKVLINDNKFKLVQETPVVNVPVQVDEPVVTNNDNMLDVTGLTVDSKFGKVGYFALLCGGIIVLLGFIIWLLSFILG